MANFPITPRQRHQDSAPVLPKDVDGYAYQLSPQARPVKTNNDDITTASLYDLSANSTTFIRVSAIDVALFLKFGDSSVVADTTDDGFDEYVPADDTFDYVVPADATHVSFVTEGNTAQLILIQKAPQ